jgi:PAS domain S-box-containing protein
MPRRAASPRRSRLELDELEARLTEAEETLNAIRSGAVDALVVHTPRGEQLFTLKGADQSYRALVEAMNEGAVTLRQNIISYCNHHFARLLHKPLEHVIGASVFDVVGSAEFPRLIGQLQKGRAHRGSLEAVLRGEAGEVPVLLSASRFYSEGVPAVCLVVTDISERKQAEEALRSSEERFQIVARMASDVIWDWDLISGRIWRSEIFETEFRYQPRQIKKTFGWWRERLHPEDSGNVLGAMNRAAKGLLDRYSVFYRFRRGDGTFAYVSDRASVLRDESGKPVRLIGTMRDVTEQREAELARQELSRSILNAQEQERQRVARDLHDGVNQLLSSAQYRLNCIHSKTANGAPLASVRELIQKAIHEVRLISRNLRPSELDDLGLVAALRSLTHDFKKRTGIDARFQDRMHSCPPRIPREVEMTLYRIAQEALNNVEKHSRASRAEVTLRCTRHQVILSVRDNGQGLAIRNGSGSGSGWGLQNMRERASLLNGSFKTVSPPKRGTTVTIQIPIAGESKEKERR